MNIPFVSLNKQYLQLRESFIAKFDEIGNSGLYIGGDQLKIFEEEVAKYCDCKYAVGVGNGSDAIFLSLKALGIGTGDEVITCPNSFLATAWAIVATGAKPVFIDVKEDLNMNEDLLEHAITSQTKAIIPIHLTGRPARMDRILDIAEKHGIFVIEDAAQAIGAKFKDKKVGSFGISGCFSLHPLKNLGVYGDGGIITTNSKELYEKIGTLRNHGLINRDEAVLWGYNSRLDPLQAGFASIKLPLLDSWNLRCREIAGIYRKNLQGIVSTPVLENSFEYSVFHNFVIHTPFRDELALFLEKRGIGTRVHYPIPIHLQKCAENLGYKIGDFPATEKYATDMLSLPIYPDLKNSEIEYIYLAIIDFFESVTHEEVF
jgi:dTDP-4-amino-4,6-dideoxygalactose transaminase